MTGTLTILLTYSKLAFKVYLVNSIYTSFLFKELNEVLKSKQGYLNKAQKKRIRFYTMQSCIVNSWFCTLRGTKHSKSERKKALYLGALTPLLDDITDSEKISSDKIMAKINSTDNNLSNELFLIKYLYEKIFEAGNNELKKAFLMALKSQDDSLKQLEKEILTDDELEKITFSKGSTWTILYRLVLENPLQEGEREAITSLGYLMQLINDAFDVYKDFLGHQQTLFTNSKNLILLYQKFDNVLVSMMSLYLNLKYKQQNIKKSLLQIASIITRGQVCMNQLLNCQKTTGNIFFIEKYKREQLICDMEKFSNIVSSFKHSKQFLRKLNKIKSTHKGQISI